MQTHIRDFLSARLNAARRICSADAATLYALSDDTKSLTFFMRSKSDEMPKGGVSLFDRDGQPNMFNVCTYAFHKSETVVIDDVYAETRFDLSGTQEFDVQTGYLTQSVITVPLSTPDGEPIGVLQMLNMVDAVTGKPSKFGSEEKKYLEKRADEFTSLIMASKRKPQENAGRFQS